MASHSILMIDLKCTPHKAQTRAQACAQTCNHTIPVDLFDALRRISVTINRDT